MVFICWLVAFLLGWFFLIMSKRMHDMKKARVVWISSLVYFGIAIIISVYWWILYFF